MKLDTAFRLAIVAALCAALFIPVQMIQGLVAERQARHGEAIAGIAEGWGRPQVLFGPYLAVPYEVTRVDVAQETVDGREREKRTERVERHVRRIAVDSIDWTLDAAVGEKARGIYRARLYGLKASAVGRFSVPAGFGIVENGGTVRVGTPRFVFCVSDAHGIRTIGPLAFDGASHAFRAGSGGPEPAAGLHVPLPALAAPQSGAPRSYAFSFSMELGGSESLALQPMGGDTTVAMHADWPHPSFQGQFLPVRHEIDAGGFTANWKISRYATQEKESLGVSFIESAGLYQRLERASKYGFLFIGLTFAAFLLVELLRRLALHPIQYTLVGLALAMFFLLLTALSEHVPFATAYGVATLACVGLVTIYLVKVLRSWRLGLAFGAALGALYAVLYALLKAEDYALLGGSLLLFGLLAAAMLATRNVDGFALTARRAGQTAP